MGISQVYIGHISGISWAYVRHNSGIYCAYLGYIMGISWAYLVSILKLQNHLANQMCQFLAFLLGRFLNMITAIGKDFSCICNQDNEQEDFNQ